LLWCLEGYDSEANSVFQARCLLNCNLVLCGTHMHDENGGLGLRARFVGCLWASLHNITRGGTRFLLVVDTESLIDGSCFCISLRVTLWFSSDERMFVWRIRSMKAATRSRRGRFLPCGMSK